jgi:tetratricopeptide (TPR) repeat protein
MNLFFPLFYLILILIFLLTILRFVIAEIFLIQKLKKQLNIIKTNIDYKQATTNTYLNLGQIYLKKKQYKNAIELFRKCLLRWDKNDTLGLSHLYTSISFVYCQLNFFDFAQYYLEESIFNVVYFKALYNLEYIYRKRGLTKKSIEINILLKNNKVLSKYK